MSTNASPWIKLYEFGIADRIAQVAANSATEKFGWYSQPALFMESIKLEVPVIAKGQRNYVVSYPLFDDRKRRYTVVVSLSQGVSGKWETGRILGLHLNHMAIYDANFRVEWDEGRIIGVTVEGNETQIVIGSKEETKQAFVERCALIGVSQPIISEN